MDALSDTSVATNDEDSASDSLEADAEPAKDVIDEWKRLHKNKYMEAP